jgi:hypothetical protein|tara:strand:- start:2429 stop:3712 length:1284 start_codon:yes stop_codon:yes gene_type:complete
MKKRLFPLLITLAALLVSGSAAFYSVFGLSKLFAGAATQVIIMAGSLEFAKLVVASLLYQYWDTINKWLRSYLAIACFVLMVITSGGIYGFLSGAYQSTATQSELLDKSLLILEQKQVRFEETKDDLTIEKTQINKSISDLRVSLSNPHQVSWYDKNSETVITSSSSSARRALQAELDNTKSERINLNLKLEAVVDSINKTDMALLNKEISNEAESELGPLKYLASTTGWPMDKVVNYFLLLIVFVFDPLAIALVVAANMAFTQIRKPEEIVIEEQKEDNTTQPSESLKQRVKENQEKLKEIDEDYFSDLEELEARMNIIGQNGNDGLHYGKEKDKNIITSTDDLNDKELNDLSREIGKTEHTHTEDPINPKPKDLEKLANALNIRYSQDNIPLERLTDTTQTLTTKKNDETNDNNKTTLKYSKRRI